MSDKYVIKNCPAFNDVPNMYGEVYGYCDNEHDIDLNKCMCENITDCLLKQIVEKCKRTLSINKGSENEFTLGKMTFAEFILKDIDIQEVE